MKKLLLCLAILSLCACQNSSKKTSYSENDEEVSLKADRSNFDDLRKDMSPEAKKENDELAGILQLLRNPDGNYEAPEKVRERFNKILRDKRTRQDKQFRTEREDFNRLEKDKREEFTESQKSEREDFLSDKPTSEKRKRFFDKQEEKRSRFYDDARERRRTFEDQISTRRRNFEDYVREKTNLFNQEYRNYQKEYDEHRKGEDLKKRMGEKASTMKRQGTPVPQPNNSGPTDQNVPNDLKQLTDEFNGVPAENTHKIESGE